VALLLLLLLLPLLLLLSLLLLLLLLELQHRVMGKTGLRGWERQQDEGCAWGGVGCWLALA